MTNLTASVVSESASLPAPSRAWTAADSRSLGFARAAVQHTSVKQLLMELSAAHLADLEKKGLLPKGKG
jgi:hypothetical protein